MFAIILLYYEDPFQLDKNALEIGDALVGVACKLAHIRLISPRFECSVERRVIT